MAISAKERLPDSGALGLRICQANLPLLAPRIAYSSFTSISEKVRRMSVYPGKFFHLMIAFVAFCLTRGRRLTFANEIASERRRAARHAYF
jgi:hypothetical protein